MEFRMGIKIVGITIKTERKQLEWFEHIIPKRINRLLRRKQQIGESKNKKEEDTEKHQLRRTK